MQQVWEFTTAIFRRWTVLLGGAGVIAALAATQRFLGVALPDYLLWTAALASVVAVSYRAWHDERQRRLDYERGTPGVSPEVLVHFDCEAEKPKPLALINASDIPAFNVKIHDLQNGDYIARFEVISQILKEWVAVDPTVEGNGPPAAERGSLMTVLEGGPGTNGPGSRTFPLHISYTDFQGREFETQYVIHYDDRSKRAVARLKPARSSNGAARGRTSHAWDRR